MKRCVFCIIVLLQLFACQSNRPRDAAKAYCKCYESKLKLGRSKAKINGLCVFELASQYKELYINYVDKEDTSISWDDVVKFYYSYTDYKKELCGGIY